jgi:osmoprotectant transport system permease protein
VSGALLADIGRMTLQHVAIVLAAVVIAALAGVPLGVYASRATAGGRLLLRVIDAIQTIPSLALFGLLIPLPLLGGIGTRTAIIALVLYSLLPIVRNTVTGIQRIDPLLIDTGLALGMRRNELLREVELPLALPHIVSGIRLALIIGIGVATIGAAVGGGGLGTLIFRGVAMVDTRLMLAGALPAAALALLADLLLTRVERVMARRRGER